MAIFGTGVDILHFDRIKNPDKLACKILTNFEYEKFLSAKNKQNFIAKNFAIKEAVAKAFGTGIGCNIGFRDIEISRSILGKPSVTVAKSLTDLILQGKEAKLHVSLSDDHIQVIAFVVIEVDGMHL